MKKICISQYSLGIIYFVDIFSSNLDLKISKLHIYKTKKGACDGYNLLLLPTDKINDIQT